MMKFDKFMVMELNDGRPFCVGYIEKNDMIVAELRETPFDEYSDRIKNGYRYLVEHREMIVKIVEKFKIDGAKGFYIAEGVE